MVYPFLTGIAGKEVAKKIAINPNVVGPLLISAVGAQNAEKIINAYDSNKILFDDILNILSGAPIQSIISRIQETPAGVVFAPDADQIEAERKFNEELNKPADVIPEEKKVTVDDVGFTEAQQDFEPLITPDIPYGKISIDDIGFTAAPQVKPSDYILTAKETKGDTKEELKPNERIFTQIAGVKNQNIQRDPNDLFAEGWENKMFPMPKQIGTLGDYQVAIDVMKRSDNNFLLFKDGKVHATIELANTMGQDNVMDLDAIGVPVEMQGQGIAKDVLNELFKLADANGVTIQGTAQPFGSKTLNTKQLVKFYNSMGFEGDANNLVRKPQEIKKEEKVFTDDVINILPEEFTPKMKTDKPYSYVEAVNPQKVFGDKDLRNEDYKIKEAPKINYEFDNKTVEQIKNKTFEEFEEATGINAKELAKKFNFTMPDTSLLNNSLQRDEKARYWWQQSGEFLDELMTDLNLNDKERELFLEIVSTTSGGVNPKQNLEIALGVMSDVLANRPVRMGFKTSQSLDVLLKDKDSKINSPKFRNYTDTFKYFAGTDDRLPNTTNDLQMAKIFGMNPEALANNPDLYALMTMTLNNLAENVNTADPQDELLQPFELQAMMWTESRGGRSTNFSEIGPQVLNEIEKLGYNITRESIANPNFVRDLQKTVKPFEESIKMTVESGSFLSPQGKKIEQLIQSFPDDSVLMSNIDKVNRGANKSLITKSGKGPSVIEELVSQVIGQKVTMSRMIQGYGTFEGNVGDNVYIPSVYSNNKGQMVQLTDDQRIFVLSVLGKYLNQAATASSNFFTVEEGMEQPDGEVMQTTSFYVPNTKFDRKQLQEVHNLSGYDFNVVPVTGGFVLDTISFDGKPNNEKVEKALQTVFGKDLNVGIIDTVWYGDYIESNKYEENINDFIQNDTRADQEVELTPESFIDIFSKIESISKKRDQGYQAIIDSTKVINLLKKNNIQLKNKGGYISLPEIPSLVNGGLVDINYLTRPLNNGR